MAATVMTHLDMVRSKAEHQRGTRMVTGLGAFVEGASNFREWAAQNNKRDKQFDSNSRFPDIRTATALKVPESLQNPGRGVISAESETSKPFDSLDGALGHLLAGPEAPQVTVQSPESTNQPVQETSRPKEPPNRTSWASPNHSKFSQAKHVEDLQEETLTTNVCTTFRRAARLIREAVDVDGSLFLDASVLSFGGLVQGPELPSGSEQTSGSEAIANTTDIATELDESLALPKRHGRSDTKPCIILGASSSGADVSQAGANPDEQIAARDVSVAETFLRALLRRVSHSSSKSRCSGRLTWPAVSIRQNLEFQRRRMCVG